MNRRTLGFILCFAAFPAASQVPNLATYHPGELHLDLSAVEASHIELDLEYLRQVLCGGESRLSNDSNQRLPPGDACRLVIANDGGHGLLGPESEPGMEAAANSLFVQPCGTAQVSVVPTGLKLKDAGSFDLGCGEWTFTASLPVNVSPIPSVLTLLPASSGASTGLFTGTLLVPLTFVYSKVGGEPSYSETQSLALDVVGRWTILQTSGAGAPVWPAADTNLILFADRTSGSGGVWFKRFGCGSTPRKCTRLCFDAATIGIVALNSAADSPW